MWTIVRFALGDASGRAEETAFEILRGAGFRRKPGPVAAPAAAVADVAQEPAVVTRAVFAALHEARLRPVFVTCAPIDGGARAHAAAPPSA
jgi:hypothetical protein